MNKNPGMVYIIEGDESVRRSLERLMQSEGIRVKTFAEAHEFLSISPLPVDACIVADFRMRDMTGLELQEKLKRSESLLPVILLTTHDTQETRTEAKKAGVAGYFRKPVDAQALLDAIGWALSETQT